jgi:hypothetical protein
MATISSTATWLQLARPLAPTPIIAKRNFVFGGRSIKLGMNNAPKPAVEADFRNVLLVDFIIFF